MTDAFEDRFSIIKSKISFTEYINPVCAKNEYIKVPVNIPINNDDKISLDINATSMATNGGSTDQKPAYMGSIFKIFTPLIYCDHFLMQKESKLL